MQSLLILLFAPLAFSAPSPSIAITDPTNPDLSTDPKNFVLTLDESGIEGKSHYTSCWNSNIKDVTPKPKSYAADMSTCLRNYNTPDWNGARCGDDQGNGKGKAFGWYKVTDGKYKDPQACVRACTSCLELLFAKGSTGGYCWDVFDSDWPNTGGGAPIDLKKATGCSVGFHVDDGA